MRVLALLACLAAVCAAQRASTPSEIYDSCVRNMTAISPNRDRGELERYCRNISTGTYGGVKTNPSWKPAGPLTLSTAQPAKPPARLAAVAAPSSATPRKPEPPPVPVADGLLDEVQKGWTRAQVLARLGAPASKAAMQGDQFVEKYTYLGTGGGRRLVRLVDGVVAGVETLN